MSRKRYTPEEIIGKLREAEVRLSQGEKIGVICRALGVSEQSYYRWRREYGGLKVDQAKRLKDLGEGECPAQTGGLGSDAGQADPEGSCGGKLLSPARRRDAVDHIQVSARRIAASGVPGDWPASFDATSASDPA